NGRIVAVGERVNNGSLDFALAVYNADGTLDVSVGGNGTVATAFGPYDDAARDVVIDPFGRFVVTGYATNNNKFGVAVARYNADASLDTSFSYDGKTSVAVDDLNDIPQYVGGDVGYAVAVAFDGKIVVAGASDFASSSLVTLLVGLTPDGSLSTEFGGTG